MFVARCLDLCYCCCQLINQVIYYIARFTSVYIYIVTTIYIHKKRMKDYLSLISVSVSYLYLVIPQSYSYVSNIQTFLFSIFVVVNKNKTFLLDSIHFLIQAGFSPQISINFELALTSQNERAREKERARITKIMHGKTLSGGKFHLFYSFLLFISLKNLVNSNI